MKNAHADGVSVLLWLSRPLSLETASVPTRLCEKGNADNASQLRRSRATRANA